MPRIFGTHMVLQRETPFPVWGQAAPGATVKVLMDKDPYTTRADSAGKWLLLLPPMPAGGPHVLRVQAGKEELRFEDVLLGDVWFGAGQSNIQFELHRTQGGPEAVRAADEPNIRLFTVPTEVSYHPEADQAGRWQVCTPETAKNFSGVQYYFGRQLHRDKNVPVGLINASWGGTPIEAFLSLEANKSLPYHRQVAQEIEKKPRTEKYVIDRSKTTPQVPASIFNAMIHPVMPYGVRGIIYYQGEHNWNHPFRYRQQLRALIEDWRIRWRSGDLPFLVVQLPGHGEVQPQPSEHFWAVLRESQREALRLPRTGLAVAIDLGDPKDQHPTNKKEVGERLALAAYGVAYGDRIVYSGPVFDSLRTEGNALRLYFSHTGSGLIPRNGELLKGFAVAGPDKAFHWAEARITGNQVVVSSPEVPNPVAVRYGWAGSPGCNLYNREGLPASPFRSDDWELRPDGTW
jgi:sialate O-acetylesterase